MEEWMNPHFDKEDEITQEQRDNMLYFNTRKYWHVYFDVITFRLYNQYFKRVLDDGREYLISNKLMDVNFNQLKIF